MTLAVFRIKSLPSEPSAKVPLDGSNNPHIRNALFPIAICVLSGTESIDLGRFLDRVVRHEIEPDLFAIVLGPSLSQIITKFGH